MTNDTIQPASFLEKSEFARSQLDQTMETFRSQFSLFIQIITLLVLGNVTVVGYAITVQISGILLIGILFPVMIIYVQKRISKLMLPVVYTAVSIEYKYGGNDIDWLASTFVSYFVSVEFVNKLKAISLIQDPRVRAVQLRIMGPSIMVSRSFTQVALVSVIIGQIIAPVILSVFFNWRLF